MQVVHRPYRKEDIMSRRSSKVVRVLATAVLGLALAGPVVTPLVAEASANST